MEYKFTIFTRSDGFRHLAVVTETIIDGGVDRVVRRACRDEPPTHEAVLWPVERFPPTCAECLKLLNNMAD